MIIIIKFSRAWRSQTDKSDSMQDERESVVRFAAKLKSFQFEIIKIRLRNSRNSTNINIIIVYFSSFAARVMVAVVSTLCSRVLPLDRAPRR